MLKQIQPCNCSEFRNVETFRTSCLVFKELLTLASQKILGSQNFKATASIKYSSFQLAGNIFFTSLLFEHFNTPCSFALRKEKVKCLSENIKSSFPIPFTYPCTKMPFSQIALKKYLNLSFKQLPPNKCSNCHSENEILNIEGFNNVF